MREVREETGVEGHLVEKLGDVRYTYTATWEGAKGERIFKVVSFFLLTPGAAGSARSTRRCASRSTRPGGCRSTRRRACSRTRASARWRRGRSRSSPRNNAQRRRLPRSRAGQGRARGLVLLRGRRRRRGHAPRQRRRVRALAAAAADARRRQRRDDGDDAPRHRGLVRRSGSRRSRCSASSIRTASVATARAAAAAGALMCVSTLTTCTHAEIREAAGDGPRWFQLYVLKDRSDARPHARGARGRLLRARAHGRHAVHRPPRARPAARLPEPCRSVRSRRSRDANLFEMTPALTWRDLEWIAARRSCRSSSRGSSRGRTRRSRSSTAPRRSSSRTTAAASSTESPASSTRCPRSPRRSPAVRGLRRRRHPARHRRPQGARARRARGARRPRADRCGLAAAGEAGVSPRARAAPRRDRARARPPRLHVTGRGHARARPAASPLELADSPDGVRAELLLPARRRAAPHRPEVGHDPARRQVGQVQEGHGRARAVRRALQPARARLRRGDRQGRGEALGDLSPREIEHDNPEIRRTDEMATFLGQLYNREVAEDDLVTVIRFSQIMNGPVVPMFEGRSLLGRPFREPRRAAVNARPLWRSAKERRPDQAFAKARSVEGQLAQEEHRETGRDRDYGAETATRARRGQWRSRDQPHPASRGEQRPRNTVPMTRTDGRKPRSCRTC